MPILKIYFEIIEKKRSKTFYFLNVAIAILFTVIIISASFDENKEPPHIRTLSFVVILLVFIAILVVRSFTIKEFKKLGQIHLTENEIIIVKPTERLNYSLDKIQNLQIEINDTADDPAGIKSMHNLEGINNYIQFIDEKGKQHHYRIYIEGIVILKLLDNFLRNWKNVNYSLQGKRSITNY